MTRPRPVSPRLTAATSQLERAAAEEGRRLAGLEERLRAERRREASLRAQARALAEELTLRDERTSLLERERETTAADQVRLSSLIAATGTDPRRGRGRDRASANGRCGSRSTACNAWLPLCRRPREQQSTAGG